MVEAASRYTWRMSKLSLRIASLLLFTAAVPACVDDTTGSSTRAIIETDCASDADCPTGFECEVEEEHGTTTSFCQADEDSDGTCPPGYELEVEHGQAFCQPHGGDDDGADAGTDSTGIGDACATDADCATGLECEVELEHGTTTSWCQPHGG